MKGLFMRVSFLSRLFCSGLLLLLIVGASRANITAEEYAKLLPDRVGEAKAAGAVNLKAEPKALDFIEPVFVSTLPPATRPYVLATGEKFEVQFYQTQSDSEAYSLLTNARLTQAASAPVNKLEGVGTAAIIGQRGVSFYKGTAFVFVKSLPMTSSASLVNFARALAAPLDEGSAEIPVIVKHLPDWETAQERAVSTVTLPALKEIMRDQPVLDVVSFEGGTEAVTATYEQGARLVIIEYSTPQFAFEGDAAITTRIAQLRAEGKQVPSAYRRVGNYAVFVFDAPDETAATGLIGRVHYEKDVRWLGDNPHANERHNRVWLNMSASVIVNTVKATGLAILACLAIGGLFGGAIFMRRRAQNALSANYSDAGGMLRLNLDELNVQHDAARLIGHGDK